MTEILRNKENLGFTAANNAAAARCETEFLALLNPDAVPEPDWLEKLVAAAKRHPRAASFASRQMLDAGRGLVDGLGDVYHPIGICWRRRHGKVLRPSDLLETETTSACAAAALYRLEAFGEVGGFDEKFFCYVEDVDLGQRLRRAVHTAVFVPDAVVEHTSKKQPQRFRRLLRPPEYHVVFFQNTPPALLPLLLMPHLLQSLAALVVCLLRGQARAFVKAKSDAIHRLNLKVSKRHLPIPL
jgi:GT2 family glycosyltransferase